MTTRWTTIRELVEEALERPQEERDAFVSRHCADDAELRAAVERLLDPPHPVQDFLEPPWPGAAGGVLREAGSREVGRCLGPWELVEHLGSGGMGHVYRARRADRSFEKEVALKLLAGDLGSPEARRRFQRETQLLAELEHPNVTRPDRRRLRRGGTPLPRDGVRRGPFVAGALRARRPRPSGAAGALPPGLRCGPACAPAPDRPSRPQTRQRPRDPGRAREARRLRGVEGARRCRG